MDIFELRSELGFKLVNEHGKQKFRGIFGTGKFDGVHDYNVGLLEVTIDHIVNGTRMIINTIDDGQWEAHGYRTHDISKLAHQLEKEWGTTLPTEKDLNDFLKYRGMFGVYTG